MYSLCHKAANEEWEFQNGCYKTAVNFREQDRLQLEVFSSPEILFRPLQLRTILIKEN